MNKLNVNSPFFTILVIVSLISISTLIGALLMPLIF
jgi:hypothetical protein